MKKAQFFCEECGTEVRMNASKCPSCGKNFAAVRCPKCSYIGLPAEFAEGCPSCGFTEESPASERSQRIRTEDSRRARNRTPSRGLSSIFYTIIGFILLAAIIILIILYSRIF